MGIFNNCGELPTVQEREFGPPDIATRLDTDQKACKNGRRMISRTLQKTLSSSPKSILLLGPRQVGKSTLLATLKPDLIINLATQAEYLAFQSNPSELEERIEASSPQVILIDEIQRIPELLNSIQVLIDSHKGRYKFLLSGSSARKLKRGSANLLPGRVFNYRLGPLSCHELDYRLDTKRALSVGTLPEVYSSSSAIAEKILENYAGTYIQEEILQETMLRQIHGFSRFLHVVATNSGQFMDFSKSATKAKVSRSAARRYFEILEDSLICDRVEAYDDQIDLVQHPKFYLFDVGVVNALLGNFTASEDRKGLLFEHLFYNQLKNTAFALDEKIDIRHFRTRGGLEVDFIVTCRKKVFAIEVKSASPSASELRPLRDVAQYLPRLAQRMIAANTPTAKKVDDIGIYPWQQVIQRIFGK